MNIKTTSYGVGIKTQHEIIAELCLVGVALFVDPLLSLFVFASINILVKIPFYILALWAFAYSTLIVNRQYYIKLGSDAGDDTVTYIPYIEKIKDTDIFGVLYSSDSTLGLEPLSRILWWGFSSLGFSTHIILFLQVVIWTMSLCLLARSMTCRYMFLLTFIGITFFPLSVPISFFHLYRHSWAMAFMAYSLVFFSSKYKLKLSIFAILSHFSSIVMVLPCLIISYSKNIRSLVVLSVILCILFVFLYYHGVLDEFVGKFVFYSSGQGPSRDDRWLKAIIGFVMFSAFYYFTDRNKVNQIVLITIFIVLILGLNSHLNSISDRLVFLFTPIAMIALVPIKKPWILFGVFIVSIVKFLVFWFSDNNVYLFAMGRFVNDFKVPILDAIVYFIQGGNI